MAKKKTPELVTDEEEALRRLANEKEIALDLETGGLSPYKTPVAVVSMYGPKSNVGAVLHVRGYISDALRTFLSDRNRTIVTHNGAGFDYLFLANAGVDVFAPPLYDTMVAEGVLLASERNNNGVSLKATAKRRLGVEIDKSLQKSTWMAETLTQAQVEYCVGDINHLLLIKEKQEQKAKAADEEEGSQFLQTGLKVETELLKSTMRMELNGIPISLSDLSQFRMKRYDEAQQAKEKLIQVLGNINFNSWQQVMNAFKVKLGVELESTDEAHLKWVEEMGGPVGEICHLMLLYRESNRPVNYYDEQWVKNWVHKGRVHCQYMQCRTETGRYSSSEPNLQNIPRDMRAVFGAYPFVKGDYSQIEVRVIADFARDDALLSACVNEDVHRAVASYVFGLPPELVSDNQRTIAKSMTFTLLFGGGAGKLYSYARQNGASITEEQAKKYVYAFFERYPQAQALKRRAYAKAAVGHMVVRLPWLKRLISGPKCKGTTWLNTIGQGHAAAGLKLGLLECQAQGIDKYLIETVHDELAGIPPEDEMMDFAGTLYECMMVGMSRVTNAPVAVEMTLGENWAKGHKLQVGESRAA